MLVGRSAHYLPLDTTVKINDLSFVTLGHKSMARSVGGHLDGNLRTHLFITEAVGKDTNKQKPT
jgi:hypothetical protein